MKGWVRFSGGRVFYRGRITRAPFVAWTATPDGVAAVDSIASRMRIPFLARRRAARHLWRQLAAAARDLSVAASIQSEADAYLSRLQDFAYADGLPRAGVDLHRLVVVPRVLINGAAHGALLKRLNALGPIAALEGGPALREFLALTLVQHMDLAVAGARPSPKRPLRAGRDWISVGLNARFVWRIPVFQQPPWDGHHYVLELTREPITRAVRKAVAANIDRFEAALAALSRTERNEVLRRATVRA
jgi:hypothetical protein